MEKQLEEFRMKLLDIFADNGVIVDENCRNQDFDLREYVEDSIQFVSALVEIESQLGIELHDEMLLFDNLASFYAFSQSIWELYQLKG